MREPRPTDPLSVADALTARLEKLGSVKGTFATKGAAQQAKGVLAQFDAEQAKSALAQIDSAGILAASRSVKAIAENHRRLESLGVSSLMSFKANIGLFSDPSHSLFARAPLAPYPGIMVALPKPTIMPPSAHTTHTYPLCLAALCDKVQMWQLSTSANLESSGEHNAPVGPAYHP